MEGTSQQNEYRMNPKANFELWAKITEINRTSNGEVGGKCEILTGHLAWYLTGRRRRRRRRRRHRLHEGFITSWRSPAAVLFFPVRNLTNGVLPCNILVCLEFHFGSVYRLEFHFSRSNAHVPKLSHSHSPLPSLCVSRFNPPPPLNSFYEPVIALNSAPCYTAHQQTEERDEWIVKTQCHCDVTVYSSLLQLTPTAP